jgi:hypothetical protein
MYRYLVILELHEHNHVVFMQFDVVHKEKAGLGSCGAWYPKLTFLTPLVTFTKFGRRCLGDGQFRLMQNSLCFICMPLQPPNL